MNNDGWIPCSEMLPDNNNYILMSFENFSTPMIGRYEEDETGGAFYIGLQDETCISQDLFVNAWKPLPDPFEEYGRRYLEGDYVGRNNEIL